ncbi:class I SAM-dependent methyltransferase [Psychrobium sp. 1_MG-2023]|uniref:class I SAM-dependent methyltransferase n=1 Tax=Psychrobium sp. 1_MG-2023 TaxID=3062624 RepID=UPI000C340C38|nr:class I SAM-dependent methyltransferase [Psychrobium sp. 1_MG-2023]MDP2561893.1 class I SAM-dependent methyltransferase [Psychrobium sp. 1_MG-2023]PKF59691.1 SAM-dependent methyltransferase [Alteromonadales bacterium alter-6D02]
MQLLLSILQQTELGSDSKRLFHGRGKCYPNFEQVTIDWFSPAIFITLFSEHSSEFEQELLATIGHAYPDFVGPLLIQRRYIHGAPVELVRGELPQPHLVQEQGLTYQVKLLDGQNNGLFLDMANGRQWVREHASGRNVLNLFSYSCSFSLAAMAGGAESVINIDMSHGALKLGKINHKNNEIALDKVKFFRHDIFKSWGKLKRYGPYQTIVIDPPSNQVGSFVAAKDYQRLLRKIPELASEQADILVCLNSPELGKDFIEQQMGEYAPDCQLIAQVRNPEVFAEIDSNKGLKVFHYRYLGTKACQA